MVKLKFALSSLAFCTMAASPAMAASISFENFATTTDNPVIDTAPIVTVDDDTAGVLTFTVSIPNANGLLSGIFIDFANGATVSASNLMSLTTGVDIVDFDTMTNDIGNGRNLNGNFGAPIGGMSGDFDFGFGFDDGDNGGAGRQIDLPFSFTLDDLGALTLASIERIGLRFQSVGELGLDGLGDGSEKLVSFTADGVVPLPAAVWFLISGVIGLGFARRRN
ncbi:MAG: VPLPA-CTERM sorting domain-containing protein [Pseudomonadota bacterium]